MLAPAIGYAQNGYPLVERATPRSQPSRSSSETIGRPRPRSICRAARCRRRHAVHQSDVGGDLSADPEEAESAGGDREAQIERARRSWSRASSPKRSTILPHARGHGLQRPAPPRRAHAEDMARWHAAVEAPLTYDYGRYTVCKGGPWSQGPVMLQQLALLKGFDLDGSIPTSADFVHLQVECAKLAYRRPRDVLRRPGLRRRADGDAAVRRLQRRAPQADRRKASIELRPGSIDGFGAVVQGARATPRRRRATVGGGGASRPSAPQKASTRGDTVHFDIVDRPATWCRRHRRAAGCSRRR